MNLRKHLIFFNEMISIVLL